MAAHDLAGLSNAKGLPFGSPKSFVIPRGLNSNQILLELQKINTLKRNIYLINIFWQLDELTDEVKNNDP
jgi:hypothetical protein